MIMMAHDVEDLRSVKYLPIDFKPLYFGLCYLIVV
jgi:hypothetical protein